PAACRPSWTGSTPCSTAAAGRRIRDGPTSSARTAACCCRAIRDRRRSRRPSCRSATTWSSPAGPERRRRTTWRAPLRRRLEPEYPGAGVPPRRSERTATGLRAARLQGRPRRAACLRPLVQGDDAGADGVDGEADAILHAELLEDVVEVALDRLLADEEPLR